MSPPSYITYPVRINSEGHIVYNSAVGKLLGVKIDS